MHAACKAADRYQWVIFNDRILREFYFLLSYLDILPGKECIPYQAGYLNNSIISELLRESCQ